MSEEKTTDALELIRRRLGRSREDVEASIARERAESGVAQQIYDLRTKHGLTQAQLAARVGTSTSVIRRLEDADYAGHSLRMLNRIAEALGADLNVEIRERTPAVLA